MELSHHLFRMTLLLNKVLMYISQLYLFVVTIIFSSESIWILWMFFIAIWIIVAAEKDEARPNKKNGRAVHYNGSWSRWRTDRSRSCHQKIHKTIRMYCQGPHPEQLQALESFQSNACITAYIVECDVRQKAKLLRHDYDLLRHKSKDKRWSYSCMITSKSCQQQCLVQDSPW